MQIKEFLSGGGGGAGGVQTRRQENSLDSVFFLFCFLCRPQPINRGVPMVLFQRGSIIFQRVQLFPGTWGGGGGGGGVQMLISIETHI